LSRLAEKIVVTRWLRPSIPATVIDDQYAFRPTGSTTAALVRFTHTASKMLESNDYVRCLLIDFSRAFDTVDHALLLAKLVKLNCPASAVNWIGCFLTNRSQYCRYNGILSAKLNINRSIVQGSGIGPTLYIIMKHDLRAISEINDLFKFADDTTCLCHRILMLT